MSCPSITEYGPSVATILHSTHHAVAYSQTGVRVGHQKVASHSVLSLLFALAAVALGMDTRLPSAIEPVHPFYVYRTYGVECRVPDESLHVVLFHPDDSYI